MIFQLLGQVPAGILWAELTQDLEGGKLRPRKDETQFNIFNLLQYFTGVCFPGNSTTQNNYLDESLLEFDRLA
jgi:hypothetical protein